ncbi:hypothetical protein CEXT_498541 [Caerostris extrusa]|uniref:Uncharacterized protein n=1 Tax=Caerostris extrusa TaxID=172846 RepID=A0AAV4TID7_CAEEX|nr:hypothetical protein CEXT_498541 [Caerostris extrusa]
MSAQGTSGSKDAIRVLYKNLLGVLFCRFGTPIRVQTVTAKIRPAFATSGVNDTDVIHRESFEKNGKIDAVPL